MESALIIKHMCNLRISPYSIKSRHFGDFGEIWGDHRRFWEITGDIWEINGEYRMLPEIYGDSRQLGILVAMGEAAGEGNRPSLRKAIKGAFE